MDSEFSVRSKVDLFRFIFVSFAAFFVIPVNRNSGFRGRKIGSLTIFVEQVKICLLAKKRTSSSIYL